MFVVLNFNTKLNSPNKDINTFKTTDPLYTESLCVSIWKLRVYEQEPLNSFANIRENTTRGALLMPSPPSTQTSPQHRSPSKGKDVQGLAGTAGSCALLCASSPPPAKAGCLPWLSTSTGSFQSPCALWDWQCQMQPSYIYQSCAGWPECTREGPGAPQLIVRPFFHSTPLHKGILLSKD